MAGLVHGQLKDWSWDYTVKFAISMSSIATQSTETVNPNTCLLYTSPSPRD